MYTPKWLKDKDKWTLSDTFVDRSRNGKLYPIVGQTVGDRVVIGVWVNDRDTLKAYKTECICGHIDEYIERKSFKGGDSKRCKDCGYESTGLTHTENKISPNIRELYDKYGHKVDIAKGIWYGIRKKVKS